MRTKVETDSEEADKRVRDIRRATRRQYSAEEKIRIVIAGLRGEDSIAELRRKEGINQNLYYRWSKDFLEADKKRLRVGAQAGASSDATVNTGQTVRISPAVGSSVPPCAHRATFCGVLFGGSGRRFTPQVTIRRVR